MTDQTQNQGQSPTKHARLAAWVSHVAALTTPDAVHWVDGSAQENAALVEGLVAAGTFVKLDKKDGSPGGIAPPGSHRSVRKPLGLYGSCHPDHQTLGTEGIHSQCANMRGNRLTIPRQHRMAFFFAFSRLYFLRIQRTR
jgi:hypothetical protein